MTIQQLRAIMELMVSGGFLNEDEELLFEDQYGSDMVIEGITFRGSPTAAKIKFGRSPAQRERDDEVAAKYHANQKILTNPALEPVQRAAR